MLSGLGDPCKEQLGLPTGPARQRAIDARREAAERAATEEQARRAAAAERAVQAELQAAADRVVILRSRAAEGLSTDANEWLSSPLKHENGRAPLTLAEQSEDALRRTLQLLREAVGRRDQSRRTMDLRERLHRAGRESAKPDHARAFLHSGQPRWGGMRPIDYCSDQGSFEAVLKLMKEATR